MLIRIKDKRGVIQMQIKNIVLICFIGALMGCALAGGTTGKIVGTDIKSAYGSGDGSITIRSQHCWSLLGGKCSDVGQDSISNGETINDTVTRSTINSAK